MAARADGIAGRFEQDLWTTVSTMRTDDIADVLHAQRLTTSGTFIHGNYWTAASAFGHRNGTHGCIGLHDAKGRKDEETAGYEFYDGSLLEDVVIVKNSGDKTVDPANGLKTAGTSPGRSGRRAARSPDRRVPHGRGSPRRPRPVSGLCHDVFTARSGLVTDVRADAWRGRTMTEHDRTAGETVVVPVTQDGVRIQVFARSAEAAADGEETEIGARRPGLDQVMSGLNAVARAVGEQARQSTASKVTLEFGCDIALESGSLVAAIGKASAKSAFKVTLEWDSASA
jgi:hypothetical protein